MNTESLSLAAAMEEQSRLQEVSSSPGLDVALLLSACIKKPRSYLYAWPERRLSASEQECFFAYLARREAGEPIAHILGRREFWSLDLKVSPASLIPRPDTECLVEKALQLVAGRPAGRLLDLGTGSGAIALALASELPGWEVLGVDLVPAAVALATENASRLGLANTRFLASDWYEGLPEKGRYDVIVSNPPYIDENDPHLQQGDVRFEPRSALVAAQQGLADIRRIIGGAGEFVSPGGALLLEHGYNQGAAVRALLNSGRFTEVATGRDYAGRERISWGWMANG